MNVKHVGIKVNCNKEETPSGSFRIAESGCDSNGNIYAMTILIINYTNILKEDSIVTFSSRITYFTLFRNIILKLKPQIKRITPIFDVEGHICHYLSLLASHWSTIEILSHLLLIL